MLALFQPNLRAASAILADMRQLALGQRFARSLAWDSFFHLSPIEQRVMYARFQAHAAPAALLMFTSGNAEGAAIGEMEGEPLYHGSRGPEEYRAMLDAAGFKVIDHGVEHPTCGYRTVCERADAADLTGSTSPIDGQNPPFRKS